MTLWPSSERPTPILATSVDLPVPPLPPAMGQIVFVGAMPFNTMVYGAGLSSATSGVLI